MSSTTPSTATTAAEYYERYARAFEDHTLVQGAWNSERDGRHVACALGVLGPDVDSTDDCPATVMPKWLAQMVPWLFDNQTEEDAFAWGLDFTAELKRLDGQVPFSVVYDWQGNVACQMGIDAAEKSKRDPAPHKALQELHRRALAGDRAEREEWRKTLRDAYVYVYANAYAYANANADAFAYADAYVYANAYANANAYADAYVYAYAYAYANANADADAYADARKKAINRLAIGLVECLRRVPIVAEQVQS